MCLGVRAIRACSPVQSTRPCTTGSPDALAPRPQEAIQDCETHLHETTVVRFVAQGLDAFVDARSAAERAAVGRLHALLLERGLLAPAQYLTALESLLEAAPDLAPDVPAVWQNLAQMVEPVLLAGRVGMP